MRNEQRRPLDGVPVPPTRFTGVGLPLSLRLYLILPGGLISAFVASAPWQVAGKTVNRLTPILAVAVVLLVAGVIYRPWRESLRVGFLDRSHRFGWRAATVFFAVAAIFLLRVVLSRYRALEVNAWDFSIYELPILAGLKDTPLASPFAGKSFLSIHASYLLFLFVPLYRLWPSHYWLLTGQALAIAAAGVAAFAVCRQILKDDLGGVLIAAGFLLNTYTAKTVQYVFHIEVLYPLCLFLVVYGFLRRNPYLFFTAVLLTALVKEDAVLVLAGVAVAGWIFWKPRWWWTVTAVIGLAAFLIATFVVMPYFDRSAPGNPWYAFYWSAYGPTPTGAALGMLRHPLQVARDVARSGGKDLLETLAFLPFVGYEWLLAALPGLVVYGTAGQGLEGVSQFPIYYSSPVIAFLVVAAAQGVARLGLRGKSPLRQRRVVRLGALSFCLASALDGASYTFYESKPIRLDIQSLRIAPGVPLIAQGAVLPQLPLEANAAPLMRLAAGTVRTQVLLLAPDANPYPFSRQQLLDFARDLARAGFQVTQTPHGLVLASGSGKQESSAQIVPDPAP